MFDPDFLQTALIFAEVIYRKGANNMTIRNINTNLMIKLNEHHESIALYELAEALTLSKCLETTEEFNTIKSELFNKMEDRMFAEIDSIEDPKDKKMLLFNYITTFSEHTKGSKKFWDFIVKFTIDLLKENK